MLQSFEVTRSGYQSQKGRANIPVAGTNHRMGERIDTVSPLDSPVVYLADTVPLRSVEEAVYSSCTMEMLTCTCRVHTLPNASLKFISTVPVYCRWGGYVASRNITTTMMFECGSDPGQICPKFGLGTPLWE
eukprot:8673113-Pyramimonas_sp.AAC.1